MFNAADYYKGMEQAGFSKDQIHALLKYQIDYMNEQFATKSDFRELRTELKADISSLESKTDALKEKIDSFEEKFAAIDKRFDDIDKRFAAIDKKFVEIDEKFEGIGEKFKSLENRMTIKLGSIMAAGVVLNISIVSFMLQNAS